MPPCVSSSTSELAHLRKINLATLDHGINVDDIPHPHRLAEYGW